MPYFIKYKTTVLDSHSTVTLRGVFEDGKYFGDIIVYDRRLSFSVEGYFEDFDIKNILKSIHFLKKTNGADVEINMSADCWIGVFPIQSQMIFFCHRLNHEYANEIKLHYDLLIRTLKNNFDDAIRERIDRAQ